VLAAGDYLKQGLDPIKEYSYCRAMPVFLRRLWEGWKRVGRKIGDFQARVLLTLFYFVILAPFAVVVRFKADPLGLKRGGGWLPVVRAADPLTRARRQF
jgi:hypothetical protein